MNQMVRIPLSDADLRRRAETYEILEAVCQVLEPTKTQSQKAKQSYEAAGHWMTGSDDPLLSSAHLYLHGSGGLGTMIKPIGRDEFDVDLICFLARVSADTDPADVKRAIGDRLKEHGTYAEILEEKKRCWRLNYAGDFHLDISPTIKNPLCHNGGELVPDRKLKSYHPTNPRGYKKLFERRAALRPILTGSIHAQKQRDEATVEPFPENEAVKGVLRRIVQLLRRHRDVYFLDITEEIAPISIIITTLAMRAYEYCVTYHAFADEIEVVVETIRMMPHFIDQPYENGKRFHAVWNETTDGENFAERWNSEPPRVKAFYDWHKTALNDFSEIRDAVGLDQIVKKLERPFGEKIADGVMSKRTDMVSKARKSGSLYIAPALGLTLSEKAAAAPVPKNEFFGE